MTVLLKNKRNGSSLPTMVDNFFNADNFFASSILNNGLLDIGGTVYIPEANIIENGKNYKIELAAPGLERKDFKVEVKDNILKISAEKENENEEEINDEKKYFCRKEFSYNSFTRSFTLPENLITDKIDAKYENGILHLTLPKKEVTVSKPAKQIKVV
jgi:HSP20 family protein